MALFRPSERTFAEAMSNLTYCNAFLPERVEWERKALGSQFVEAPRAYSRRLEWELEYVHPNLTALAQRVEGLTQRVRRRLAEGAEATESELVLYEDLALHRLYRPHLPEMDQIIAASLQSPTAPSPIPFWDRFLRDFNELLLIPGRTFPIAYQPANVFAGFFQIRRAFFHIYHKIFGASMPAVELRGDVWRSVFTHNMRRYFRSLYKSMGDVTTLITGPSGTGKELVAEAIARSQYIPFDPKTKEFQSNFAASFHPVNLSALAPTLIESELFGHIQGAFTGAVKDRKGRLEECDELGTVFLDEIGELDAGIQVKLLRVFQDRTFQRLGETENRTFEGKITTATNRDLAVEMRSGRFRTDLYYRLCADQIETPSLREQLADSPDDLHDLILFIARQRIQLSDEEAAALAPEVETWIDECPSLGRNYPWPGNVRELEQCVRNVMIRKEYHPVGAAECDSTDDPCRALAAALSRGELTAEELLRHYCTQMYAQCGSLQEAARRLRLDRRTVKSKIDHRLLESLSGQQTGCGSQGG